MRVGSALRRGGVSPFTVAYPAYECHDGVPQAVRLLGFVLKPACGMPRFTPDAAGCHQLVYWFLSAFTDYGIYLLVSIRIFQIPGAADWMGAGIAPAEK